jgi:hypothetical protein
VEQGADGARDRRRDAAPRPRREPPTAALPGDRARGSACRAATASRGRAGRNAGAGRRPRSRSRSPTIACACDRPAGGRVLRAQLLQYRVEKKADSPNVVLLDDTPGAPTSPTPA